MKLGTRLFTTLAICTLAFTSCEKDSEFLSVDESSTVTEIESELAAMELLQQGTSTDLGAKGGFIPLNLGDLNGNWRIRYSYINGKGWQVADKGVGLKFFPNSFLYYTSDLNFSYAEKTVGLKVDIGFGPNTSYGSIKTAAGDRLGIIKMEVTDTDWNEYAVFKYGNGLYMKCTTSNSNWYYLTK